MTQFSKLYICYFSFVEQTICAYSIITCIIFNIIESILLFKVWNIFLRVSTHRLFER